MANRTQVADYVAGHLASDRDEAMREAAAWLVATGRSRQADYLARDVAKALVSRGYLLARVTTARPLDAPTRQSVEQYLRSATGATHIELELVVDPAVIGGIRLETPTAQLDATIRQKLVKLVEGVLENE